MSKEELKYLIALGLLPGIGPVKARNIMAHFGGVDQVFENQNDLIQLIPKLKKAEKGVIGEAIERAHQEVEWAEKNNVQLISYLDKAFPYRLKNTYDHPLVLFYKGNTDLNNRKVIGIVGTRNATNYGKKAVREIIEAIAPYKPLVISGLAYGIDIAAHTAALDKELDTVAVLGHGLHTIYPSVHRNIAAKMTNQGGLLTEFMSDSKFEKENFPKRNRIVAGMLDALIVVETKKKGGSMITAEIAFSCNRDVFAVPGNYDQENSQGCNYLIKILKAQILDDPAKFPEQMAWQDIKGMQKNAQYELPLDLKNEELKVIDLLKENAEIPIDQLSIKSGYSNSFLAGMLLELEFKGLITQLPGKIYKLS
ncbi:MAG: DNA-processing protein DprA [Chitinophagales bacterium]